MSFLMTPESVRRVVDEAVREDREARASLDVDSAAVSMATEWALTRNLAELLRAALLHIESNDPPEAWRQADWARRVRETLREEVDLRAILAGEGKPHAPST